MLYFLFAELTKISQKHAQCTRISKRAEYVKKYSSLYVFT